ncbi:DUF2023 family protein [Marinifilum sp.]|uniref:DUF2023 family protein n=1 Tax=Marinifilum sp. TaxID=2033137 RepID=UPI003BA8E0B1
MKLTCSDYKTADMQILIHHVYEYNKGLRSLVLHTMNSSEKEKTENLLQRKGISYFLQTVSANKINVFFGTEDCIKIVKSFGDKSLSDFTDEQDFILGIMLGYARNQQYDRYIKRKGINSDYLNSKLVG